MIKLRPETGLNGSVFKSSFVDSLINPCEKLAPVTVLPRLSCFALKNNSRRFFPHAPIFQRLSSYL